MNLVYPTRYFPTFSSPTYPWNGNNPLIRLVSIENEENTWSRRGAFLCKKKKRKGKNCLDEKIQSGVIEWIQSSEIK